MEKLEPQFNETIISKESIAGFAKMSYARESGIKKAVDEGRMSMRELEIFHYINAWTNHNMPFVEGPHGEEYDKIYLGTLEKALQKCLELYSINDKDAREIYEKVCNIPTVA